MLYPLTFLPIFKERIWGGRNLARLYGKELPGTGPIGESWEISDRPGDESIIANGPLAGQTLRWLMQKHGGELLGAMSPRPERFPLLVKILDAQEKLSLQVHPPADLAEALGGEPKTEMWYVAEAGPNAELFVGLKQGATREEFEKKLTDQTVADCFHRIKVKAGDAMFLPSGRVHALGAENVIFEIQQNSDTTYRVFDWNRVDAKSGKPRDLHIAPSLASIDFQDFEPSLLPAQYLSDGPSQHRPLVKDPLFHASVRKLNAGDPLRLPEGKMQILGMVEGRLRVVTSQATEILDPGKFCLIPACCRNVMLQAEGPATFLQVQA